MGTEGISVTPEQREDVERQLRLPRVVPGLADCGRGFDQRVLMRGDCHNPGEVVPRRYVVLGTDGFGRSDTREKLRRFF